MRALAYGHKDEGRERMTDELRKRRTERWKDGGRDKGTV